MRDVAIRQPDAARGQPVDVGRLNVLAAVTAEVSVTKIVGDDEDDVGFAASAAWL
jgi:hypothetical protein